MGLQGKAREAFEKKLEPYVGIEIGIEEVGRDEINQAMIRHWCEALDNRLPVYQDQEAAAKSIHGEIVAPPTMLQAWILPGMEMATGDPDPNDKQKELHRLFDSVGYSGVVATNTEQEYVRYLKLGDRVRALTVIESISEQKATGLGIGYFIDTRTTFRDERDEVVGWMTFRVLKFEPGEQPATAASDSGAAAAKPVRIRPALGHDNQWWWDGVAAGHFLIQRCEDCGVLRHPPRPMCGECQSVRFDSVPSTGQGSVYSYVVIHYPEVPGYEYPLTVAVVDLEEGVRFVSNVVDCAPEDVEIGMQVQAEIREMDPEFKMVVFKPVL
ncbi:MAG: bifunctional MaoC family dehydratase/OB-fold nucleic acid binding domain-containing protein [Deltaproteobacteria bacterium]|nr:bifunctional MaoC family dehydratase/OB-fold nucleic acid binding domain-containing protein [Deltaproteobacteria bacterium]MBW2723469.1 bifunctional MaoC family dehydratase/OB-fold nucleic acid binding domain-containing protein [Deltaproteobacteria bacterium]